MFPENGFILLKMGKIEDGEYYMIFQIGTFTVPYYGFFIALGIVAASVVGLLQVRHFHLDANDFIIVAAVSGLGGFVGAKLLYLLVSWHEIDVSRLLEPEYLNELMQGGFVFYGGVIGGVAAMLACGKIRALHVDSLKYAGICIPCVPAAHAFGRIGCRMAGCCYGIPYQGPGSIVYHHSSFAPNEIELFPVQSVEAVGELLIVAVLLIYLDSGRSRSKSRHGMALYFVLYVILRFVLEFFRYDGKERGIWGIFSTSQWISLAILAGLAVWAVSLRRKERETRSGACL